MFFNKNKEEVTDQLSVYQERGAPRWGAPSADLDAGVSISGFEGEGQLGNVSITGCSIKSVTYAAIKPDETYQIRIMPGKEDKLEPFSIDMKLSWTKCSEDFFLAGFSTEKNSMLKKYTDILKARGYPPEYGNMKGKN